MPSPRAFVLEPVSKKLDIEKADRFAPRSYIYEVGDKRPSIWDPDFITMTLARLEESGYDPRTDYFVCAGSMVSLIKVIAALVANFNTIRVLMYSATDRDYILQEIGNDA